MSSSIQLFSSDLDGTLLGNPESERRFKTTWENLPAENRPLLIYNSGRLIDDLHKRVTEGTLPAADYYICGVGIQIYDVKRGQLLDAFQAHLAHGWDNGQVQAIIGKFPGTQVQPGEFQHLYKSSWFLERAAPETLHELKRQLGEAGLDVNVIYSSSRDLDILPRNATKAGALRWLCEHLHIALENVLVAGDTGNDASMFRLPGVRGIIVDNAMPELFEATVDLPVYSSRLVMADGVLDGLLHHGVIHALPRPDETKTTAADMPSSFRMLFNSKHLTSLTAYDRTFIRTAYEKAIIALKKNITPLGFSACSLTDNTVTGTDANYRSVWARDGAITVIYSLELDDEEVRAAQKRTLETLLNATSPAGQIPANVRIDDGKPDYSGVGNIASIDSGLWVVIAVYNYVVKTNDLDLLHRHAATLQKVMNWLTAHDSNNDGLLEIPEAADWTDLFGRSYNVLYDEVLWFRTNVCYGRLLEMLGDFTHAADYLRWSQHIRGRVLESFWPSISASDLDKRPNRFADRQFALGDTQYLLAEITPFAFNWRCDVFGNVLAFLMNMIDADRARTTFKFMWGVGVNSPWPVANLYPVVQSGDPDWRPYYTVNLLNLPNHYHNGGVWPFVGGMWVRYIHRLGFHDVACRELLQLAKLNQLGRDHEWEFNEWAHGTTGRPMGKAYQAWSAASFIRACQELEAVPTHEGRD